MCVDHGVIEKLLPNLHLRTNYFLASLALFTLIIKLYSHRTNFSFPEFALNFIHLKFWIVLFPFWEIFSLLYLTNSFSFFQTWLRPQPFWKSFHNLSPQLVNIYEIPLNVYSPTVWIFRVLLTLYSL